MNAPPPIGSTYSVNTRPETTRSPVTRGAYYRRMKRGEPRDLRWGTVATPVGRVLVAVTDEGVAVVEFIGDPAQAPDRLRSRFPNASFSADLPTDSPEMTAVQAMVTDGTPAQIPVAAEGTPFQQLVWAALQDIPIGETHSYAEVAAAIGRPKAVRAVASACARNPVAVVVPCHRVVRSDGGLGGYAYGLAIKEHLLAVERQRAAAA